MTLQRRAAEFRELMQESAGGRGRVFESPVFAHLAVPGPERPAPAARISDPLCNGFKLARTANG
jgi:hypothetical protein